MPGCNLSAALIRTNDQNKHATFHQCNACPVHRLLPVCAAEKLNLRPGGIECFRFYNILLGYKNMYLVIIMKSTNPPTQGQPNPRKIRLQVAFGPLFPPANKFSWVSIVFFRGNIFKETQPGQILRKHPICNYGQGEG